MADRLVGPPSRSFGLSQTDLSVELTAIRDPIAQNTGVLSKNNGGRPKGHKGAFEKAREEHRLKYGNASTCPRSSSRDSKGKGKGRQSNDSRKTSMKPLLPNKDSSDDSESESPAMALKSLRTSVFVLRAKDAPVNIEHDNMYGALRCDGENHDDHVLDPLTPLVAPTIVQTIGDATDREQALGALGGWAKVKAPRKAKSPKN